MANYPVQSYDDKTLIFQNVATWTVALTAAANPGIVPAMTAGTATSATSRPATPDARLTDRAPTAPACAQMVKTNCSMISV